MLFEFDLPKSETNRAKHGIDFVKAQELWNSTHVVLPARDVREKRFMIIGTIDRQFWSAIITYRRAAIRIISVRKSTAREIATYEETAR